MIIFICVSLRGFYRQNFCVIFSESGGDSIKDLPQLQSALNKALRLCAGDTVLIDSGSIFEMKENYVFIDKVPEKVLPGTYFLKENFYDFSAITLSSLRIPADVFKSQIEHSAVVTGAVNVEGIKSTFIKDFGKFKVLFTSYISDKEFGYLPEKTRESYGLSETFFRDSKKLLSKKGLIEADMKVSVFDQVSRIGTDADELSEMQVYFHNTLPDLNLLFLNSFKTDSIKDLRKGLTVHNTEKTPSVTVVNYSIIRKKDDDVSVVLKKDIQTVYAKGLPHDEKMKEIIEPYVEFYKEQMTRESGNMSFDIICENNGKEECILNRLYSEVLVESVSECGFNVDISIARSFNHNIKIERGSGISGSDFDRIFPLREQSAVLELTWGNILDIMNDENIRNELGYLSMNPGRYRYDSKGLFVPERNYDTEKKVKVAVNMELLKMIDDIFELESEFCVSGISPAEVLFNNLTSMRRRYFVPSWRVVEND